MNVIVVVDAHWGIGCGGDQLVYISSDLKRFQALTMDHAIIVGRKTLATFPGGRPLRGRTNLILSATQGYQVEDAEVFTDLEALLAVAPADAFVVGGARVYQDLLPYCDTAYVTKIQKSYPADCFFPNLDSLEDWHVTETSQVHEEDGLRYQYITYKKLGTLQCHLS